MRITIFLADDHPIVRDGLRAVLETQSDLQVVGETGSGREAVRRICHERPDIVILDITMPDLDGVEVARRIRTCSPDTGVIILSVHATTRHVTLALEAGAKGYLLKGIITTEAIEAVRAVQTGRRYLSPGASNLVSQDHLAPEKTDQVEDPLGALSPREREVLQLVVEGQTSSEIAGRLALTRSTVDSYRYRIMQKLNIKGVPQLIKFAIQSGLTSIEEPGKGAAGKQENGGL